MAVSLISRINIALNKLELLIHNVIRRRFPPDEFCLAVVDGNRFLQPSPASKVSLKDIFENGFLWAVPKHRRSLEKRLKRKYGTPEYVLKILTPRTNLRTCVTCGSDHEAGVLCPTCYKKVIDETKAMQESIQAELKLEPIEKEVVVLYDGEKDGKSDEFFEGNRVVEMKKPRPSWFSKNLLQQTTQKPATTTDVKPSELG